MAILLDPSAVVAAADVADLNHRAAVAWFARVDEPLLLGALGLAELDLLLQRELGVAATEAVLQALVADAIRLVSPTRGGPRARDGAHARGGGAPAAARGRAAGRQRRSGSGSGGWPRFDRRPLAVFRPRHVRTLDFEP